MSIIKSKAEKCRNLHYKKPALMNLGYFAITEKLDDIQEVCSEIHWAFDDDEQKKILKTIHRSMN